MKELLSSVSEKGQITIPLEIRQALKIKRRDKVAFRLVGNHVEIIPVGSPLQASFQSVPALKQTLSDKELTQIAAEEHARHAAREGL